METGEGETKHGKFAGLLPVSLSPYLLVSKGCGKKPRGRYKASSCRKVSVSHRALLVLTRRRAVLLGRSQAVARLGGIR